MIELSFPGDLTDADELATQLFTTGLSRGACQSKAALPVSRGVGLVGHSRGPKRSPAARILCARTD